MNAKGCVFLMGALLLAGCAGTPEPGTGDGARTLASAEVEALREGRGMGLAAVAEINGYPGPMHVLELKEKLELTPDQQFATSRLLGLTKGRARALGERIVEAERQLDADMAAGKLNREQVRSRIQTIGALRSELRHVHVDAHLQQKKILTPEQVRRYYELRGRKVHVPPPMHPPRVEEPLSLPAAVDAEEKPQAAPTIQDEPIEPAYEAPKRDVHDERTPAPAQSPEPTTAPMPDAAPASMSPGMRDAMDEAEPISAPPLPEPEAAPEAAPETPAAEKRQRSRQTMTPGMQDAMEFAEPDTGNELEVPPLPEDWDPAGVTLDN